MNENQLSDVAQQLCRSRIYQDYKLAFAKSTHLPLELFSTGAQQEVSSGLRSKHGNSFCGLLAHSNKTCEACPEAPPELRHPKLSDTQTIRCFAGLTVTTVPVKLEEQVIAFLRTGRVFLQNPNAKRLQKISAQLMRLGMKVDLARLEEAYFQSPVVSPDSYHAIVRLLEIFAAYLTLIADRFALQSANEDSPLIKRAKNYVAGHLSDPISLAKIARALSISTFHFCRIFRQSTGLTFVEYLSRVRIERAKILLSDDNLRVSEIAYEAGFQTITHFNRIFRKLVGCSPTEYRSRLAESFH